MNGKSPIDVVFLVDFNRRTMKKIGFTTGITDDKRIEKELVRRCEMYKDELMKGLWVFVARYDNGAYEAKYRMTYAEWMVDEGHSKYPYYFDVAENDERAMFSMVAVMNNHIR